VCYTRTIIKKVLFFVIIFDEEELYKRCFEI